MKKEALILASSLLLLSLAGCSFPPFQDNNEGAGSSDPSVVTIGYIGCSNTRETVEGYAHLGGKKMWDSQRRYGSGTILDWSQNVEEGSKYWDVFDELLEKYPNTNTIWFELCIMDEDRATSYEHAALILSEIRKRIPAVTIYVSPLADYTEGICEITGTFGLEKGKELAKELDEKNEDVLPGPVLGPMTPKDTAKDGCHLSSPDGKRKLGNQMRLFFDAEEYSADEASIGYIGCSNTMQTIAAYWSGDYGGKGANSGDDLLWTFYEDEIHEYDSGAVVDWSRGAENGNTFWETFDRYLENNPNTKAIFWQLCVRKEEPTPYEEALPVLEAIRERIPGAVIYVSPLPPYTDGVCEITGTLGIERAGALAEELIERNEDVLPGPMLGPMTPEDTDEDGCHLSEAGMQTIGKQMRDFFGGLENKAISDIENEVAIIVEEGSDEQSDEAVLEELSPEEQLWSDRIEKAMAATSCPDAAQPTFPDSYYLGPLVDTHLHIPSIPDWSAEEDVEMQGRVPEGRFGGPQALLGWNVRMSDIACTLTSEGTRNNFAFFPAYEGKIFPYQLEMWNRTMAQYPELFTPFIMSSGDDSNPQGFPTVDAATLREMLSLYPGLFEGYGEIGLYARENGGSPELPPDSLMLQEIYPLVRENNLVVYFHLGDGHKDTFEKVLEQYPDITFIWHGDQLSVEEVKDVLRKHPNANYGVDEFFGGEREIFELYVGKSKEEYLASANKNFDKIINQDINHWESLIEQYPDQVTWGTDRGDAVWNYDSDVGQMQVKIARAFIGKLDKDVQEKFAYKNAERLVSG